MPKIEKRKKDVKHVYSQEEIDRIVVEHRIVEKEDNLFTINTLNLVFTRENGIYSGTDITRYPYKIIHKELGIKKL